MRTLKRKENSVIVQLKSVQGWFSSIVKMVNY